MKRMILGVTLFMGGLIGVLVFITLAMVFPYSIGQDSGMFASMSFYGTLVPFLLFCIIGITGLVICIRESEIINEYKEKNERVK